jgi:hypothetical protein
VVMNSSALTGLKAKAVRIEAVASPLTIPFSLVIAIDSGIAVSLLKSNAWAHAMSPRMAVSPSILVFWTVGVEASKQGCVHNVHALCNKMK